MATIDYKHSINVMRGNLAEHEYKAWRMGLGTKHRHQYAIDIDQLEFRGEELLAMIDLKNWPTYESEKYWDTVRDNTAKYSSRMYRELAERLGVVAYYCFANFPEDKIRILSLMDLSWRVMTVGAYEEWLMTLPE